MARFKVEYWNSRDEEYAEDVVEYEDSEQVSAEEWAEDAAYTVADKHWYRVTRLD